MMVSSICKHIIQCSLQIKKIDLSRKSKKTRIAIKKLFLKDLNNRASLQTEGQQSLYHTYLAALAPPGIPKTFPLRPVVLVC